jgi:ABC-type phosphate/phosphonate transport system substrate-binding protein
MKTTITPAKTTTLVLVLLILSLFIQTAFAKTLTLVVQPIMSPDQTTRAYQPLAQYLSEMTGQDIKLIAARNFFTFWESMKQDGKYDLVLSAAHLTDYLIERRNYHPLAKLPDSVSFSLVTGADTLLFSPDELIGQKIATLGSPSMGAVKLAELFPNPLRQPIIIEVANSQAAVAAVQSGKAVAAIIPSPLVQQYPDLNTIKTTEQTPHMCLTASGEISPELQKSLSKALLDAGKTQKGQAMLKALNLPGFQPATSKQYAGFANLLEGVWGY